MTSVHADFKQAFNLKWMKTTGKLAREILPHPHPSVKTANAKYINRRFVAFFSTYIFGEWLDKS